MELKSVIKFNELASTINERRNRLEVEQIKYQRQLAYFTDELERSQTLNNTDKIIKAEKAITVVSDKLKEVENGLEELNLKPVAELVIQEAEEKLCELREEFEAQWEKIFNKRIEFLKELNQLGNLIQRGCSICYSTNGAAKVLRRNPLNPPGVSGQHQLVVDLAMINGSLRV